MKAILLRFIGFVKETSIVNEFFWCRELRKVRQAIYLLYKDIISYFECLKLGAMCGVSSIYDMSS